jgi:hypothetical protein
VSCCIQAAETCGVSSAHACVLCHAEWPCPCKTGTIASRQALQQSSRPVLCFTLSFMKMSEAESNLCFVPPCSQGGPRRHSRGTTRAACCRGEGAADCSGSPRSPPPPQADHVPVDACVPHDARCALELPAFQTADAAPQTILHERLLYLPAEQPSSICSICGHT